MAVEPSGVAVLLRCSSGSIGLQMRDILQPVKSPAFNGKERSIHLLGTSLSAAKFTTPTLVEAFLSREQIRKETAAMGKEERDTDAPWGIISVKAQDVDHEIPMQPITMMRNALGKEEGGSGVDLDRQKYAESVNFWKDHAPVK